jgi:hypothetical protein
MDNEVPIAGTIQERLAMNEQGLGGSVMSDLAEAITNNDFQEWEDYFGDEDPFSYL